MVLSELRLCDSWPGKCCFFKLTGGAAALTNYVHRSSAVADTHKSTLGTVHSLRYYTSRNCVPVTDPRGGLFLSYPHRGLALAPDGAAA